VRDDFFASPIAAAEGDADRRPVVLEAQQAELPGAGLGAFGVYAAVEERGIGSSSAGKSAPKKRRGR
jgi:hypothetical protein